MLSEPVPGLLQASGFATEFPSPTAEMALNATPCPSSRPRQMPGNHSLVASESRNYSLSGF